MYRFIFLFGVCFAAAPDTLRMVNVLYRHGDRSPMTLYPTDPHKLDVWPQGLGWLSKIGMRQQYALGQWLRSEYGNILSAAYNNTEIRVDASDVNRCLMSAYCNLAGLYPPNGTQVWNDKLLWQPIPVHTRPEYEDNTLAMDAKCPLYDELYAAELHSDVVTEEERVNAEFYKLLENKTGVVRENISDVWEVADTLFCEKCHNLTLPTWTQQMWKDTTVYDKLMNLSHWGFDLLYNGTQITRLKGVSETEGDTFAASTSGTSVRTDTPPLSGAALRKSSKLICLEQEDDPGDTVMYHYEVPTDAEDVILMPPESCGPGTESSSGISSQTTQNVTIASGTESRSSMSSQKTRDVTTVSLQKSKAPVTRKAKSIQQGEDQLWEDYLKIVNKKHVTETVLLENQNKKVCLELALLKKELKGKDFTDEEIDAIVSDAEKSCRERIQSMTQHV